MKSDNELIHWTDRLSIGIKVIDDQHRGLVDLVNEMFNHATGNYAQERDYFSRIIHETVKYVKDHFSAEEKMLLAMKYPGYGEHKKAHETFVHAILENAQAYEAGKRFTLSTFTRFLKDWILSHIALMDKQYAEYLKKTVPDTKTWQSP
ncbi:MAG: bacteriohemerythrin [Treponema sp.]|nr:bacteriohemerythrin [Treponema sp.]